MKFIKQISLYTFVGFFNAGISFFLMPYLSHFIDPAGYGILSMLNSFITVLVPVIGLTAAGLIYVEFYKKKSDEQYASLFSSIQVIPVLPALIILVISMVFSVSIAGLLEIPPGYSYWIPLSVILAVLSIYYDTLLSYNVIEQKPVIFVKYSIIRIVTEVLLTILFVSFFKLGWEGRMLSWLISTVLSFLMSVYYFKIRALLTLKIKKEYIVAGIAFGLPLILHNIGKFVINQSDRIFIAKMISIEESGVYNIGYQVGMVLLILVNGVGNFYQPYLFSRLTDMSDKAKIEIVRATYFIIAGLLVSLIVLTLISPLLFRYLIDKSYSKGIIYVFWTGLSYFFWGIYILFAGFIFYKKQTKFLGYLAILNVLLNILLNYLLIRELGAIGAVYATCISFFVVSVFVVWRATKMYRLPWSDFRSIIRVSG